MRPVYPIVIRTKLIAGIEDFPIALKIFTMVKRIDKKRKMTSDISRKYIL